ncbi:MAG: hypothetical protein SPL10_01260 [Synergistales bacterium]|nr:hypothetical protein [Synergistales bacterium]MDY6401955.1 hypothetical protein [Synergistales bacterium]MDY6404465.1 hypothetical protein [Synergistales bacterium]MDY6410537.1 hypothetical protein [Synergistales bacterium]MDY6413773.1 hypothetical protein [Synergistales bacterium]
MRKYLLLFIFFIFSFLMPDPLLLTEINAAEIPRANLDEAERFFNNAYVHFMRRDYREAQLYLDHAINENTYMVDYYLLSSLNLSRMGDTEGAMSAIKSYLEVRPMDDSAPRIRNYFEEQDRVLRAVLDTVPLPVSWRSAETTVQTEWDTGYTRPFSIKGLGKISTLGEIVSIPDTFGDKLYVRNPSKNLVAGSFGIGGSIREIDVPSPVIALPLGDGTFRVFTSNGDLYMLKNLDADADAKLTSADYSEYIATLPSMVVADAEILAENFFAVADPADRNIAFYVITPSGLSVRTWEPPLGVGDLLFEPVAVEGYADWLAIADRANDRIYLLNAVSHEYFDIRGISKPRDLIWTSFGNLFVLTEDGDIFDFTIDFGTRTYANRHSGPLYSGLKNIWSFFHSAYGDINCMDIGASRIFKAVMIPSREDVPGFLSIYNPVMATNTENNESFILDATLITPFVNYSHNTRIIAQSVWNERNMRCNVMWQKPKNFDALLIHGPMPRGQAFPLNVRPAQVTSGLDINSVLSSFWLLHKDTLTNIIVDASIPMRIDDLLMLLKFCVLNGLELDIYARDVPSLSLKRASAFTGGRTIYSMANTISLPVKMTHLQIQIPLPQELSSSGYPGRSMLAMFLDAGLIQSRAWIPLYPDMFER